MEMCFILLNSISSLIDVFLLLEKPIHISLYAVIDSFHDIREDQMVSD